MHTKKEIKGIGHYSSAAFISQGAHEVRKAHLMGTSLRDRLGLDGLNRSRHVVGCEDSAGLHRYLRGAISAVVVHP